jgi:methylated-DNA-[protein]-cysteine S-methyltransferase
MEGAGFALFATPIGTCGIAWSPHGLRGVQLPEADEEAGLARLAHRFADLALASPEPVADVIAEIGRHLSGEPVGYQKVKLDFGNVHPFERSVYAAARAIPFGETRTYGALAAQVGDPLAAQAVGQALGRNPWPIIVPCHRITAADGRTGGFSAPGGTTTKLRLLEIEGALAPENLPLFAAAPHD